MHTTIVTGFSAKGYAEYGRRFMDTFEKHNNGHRLHIYTDDVPLLGGFAADVKQIQQHSIPGLEDFLARHATDKTVCGTADGGAWKPKETKAGYSYRFDAHKFCKMVFTMWAAAHHIGEGYMVWLDGDTVVRQDIPKDLAERALPDGQHIAYLGREPKHTETGFLVFKLPEALPVLDSWARFYSTDSFKQQREWHSAFLFDRAREHHAGVHCHNLTPGGKGHVIHKCWVGSIFDHQKGARKGMAKSPEAK